MNVRAATPEDEPWLIDALERAGDHDPGFRWYHYVVVTSEDGERVGCGRLSEREDAAVLTHVAGFGEQATLAKAHAARNLVEQAVDDGFESVLVAAELPRPFEAIGFREADAAEHEALDAGDDATAMRWFPPSEREDEADETEDDAEQSDDEIPADEGTDGETTEPSESDRGTHKYDPSASSPSAAREPDPQPEPADDDSTTAAARRQGFNPDSVNTKYDTTKKRRSRSTKYDTAGGKSADTTDESTEASDGDASGESRSTKYDTDETEDTTTKYST